MSFFSRLWMAIVTFFKGIWANPAVKEFAKRVQKALIETLKEVPPELPKDVWWWVLEAYERGGSSHEKYDWVYERIRANYPDLPVHLIHALIENAVLGHKQDPQSVVR